MRPERGGARIIVALDFPQPADALSWVAQLDPARCRVKVGLELFTAGGPAIVERLMARGFEVFLDLKFHDIPHTVAMACRRAGALGVWMCNVHAAGGRDMLLAAVDGIAQSARRPWLTAVTVLTSQTQAQLRETGVERALPQQVAALAAMAAECGLDGVVCSPQEVTVLRSACAPEFLLVTPGVRPLGSAADDQRRVATPGEAVRAGASYLVIGRPITGAPDPMAALTAIEQELALA